MPSHAFHTEIPVAVVGVGRMGKYHCQNFAKMAGKARLIGVLDRSADRARQAADEFKTQAFGSVDELIAALRAEAGEYGVPHLDPAKRGKVCL